MKVALSSDGYSIVSSGQAFLFGADKDLEIHVQADNGFEFGVILKFVTDDSEKYRIDKSMDDNRITLTCVNFEDAGTGLSKPVRLARIDDKELFLMFWSYLEGADHGKVRSVKYTIFMQEQLSGRVC